MQALSSKELLHLHNQIEHEEKAIAGLINEMRKRGMPVTAVTPAAMPVAPAAAPAGSPAPNNTLTHAAICAAERDDAARADALHTLARRELIERTDAGYRIAVPLIAEYVRRKGTV